MVAWLCFVFMMDDCIVGMSPKLMMNLVCWNGFYDMLVAHVCVYLLFYYYTIA